MSNYVITSNKFEGAFYLAYGNGWLVKLDLTEANLSKEQHAYVLGNLPLKENELKAFAATAKLQCKEQITQVTFEVFYNAYGYKEGRKKAENAWNKLSKAEQIKAYQYISVLKAKKAFSNENLPYPATYLNQQRWSD
ncbi:MAG: hypothetical protein KF872_06055 [Chitinophagales bacterium]|nr:hypothetical protein [Chitinophagales bacterium]